ncbi:hypothetical protein SAMN04487935_3774 [Flavobacterium noncentrifugens]|uniref:Uncharacterized protein n=1 Tax=Flavobacterium noncentrifugens TaxID=1128970 RepID=A0A1G9DC98_9FLAO|nr:hypothetical protein SAMN04487935_3774 [Flavobacterium noncentrifugens]
MAYNVSRLKRGCDSSGLSFLCQDKTFFVKTKFPVTKNQQSSLAAVSGGFYFEFKTSSILLYAVRTYSIFWLSLWYSKEV